MSDTPIPGPPVPLRGHWENFAVCTSSMDGNYCCDPMESALGDGACGTTQYHTGDGKNIYKDYSRKSAMAPGGYYSCEMNPLLGECIAEAAILFVLLLEMKIVMYQKGLVGHKLIMLDLK